MSRYFASSALLASGWHDRVLFEVAADGMITAITPRAETAEVGDAEVLEGAN